MGKRKRRNDMDRLDKRLRRLEKTLARRYHYDNEDDEGSRSSRSSTPNRSPQNLNRYSRSRTRSTTSHNSPAPSRSPTPKICHIEQLEEEEKGGTSRAIEDLLGQEGAPTVSNAVDLNENLATRWSSILQSGLSTDTKLTIVKKHDAPKNVPLLIPPILNEEVAAAMNENGIKRDKRITDQQTVLAAAITALGRVLNEMIPTHTNNQNIQFVESLSDSARLLCSLYHENTVTRRALILPGLNKDVKETMEKTPISEYLFGDKLQDKVNACKAVKKSAQELKNTPPQIKLPPRNLNHRGPQRPQVPRPSGPKQKPRRATYQPFTKQPATRPRRSPPKQYHPRRQDHRRR